MLYLWAFSASLHEGRSLCFLPTSLQIGSSSDAQPQLRLRQLTFFRNRLRRPSFCCLPPWYTLFLKEMFAIFLLSFSLTAFDRLNWSFSRVFASITVGFSRFLRGHGAWEDFWCGFCSVAGRNEILGLLGPISKTLASALCWRIAS